MKLFNVGREWDWIQDLYYKEMVIRSNKENNHEKYKRPKRQTEESSERHR